jgi:hypothetical protein
MYVKARIPFLIYKKYKITSEKMRENERKRKKIRETKI